MTRVGTCTHAALRAATPAGTCRVEGGYARPDLPRRGWSARGGRTHRPAESPSDTSPRGYGSGLAISQRDVSGGINVAVENKPEPEPGDVYRVTPATSPLGDAHGHNRRPAGVVELSPHVAHTLTRTTHPQKCARVLNSPANPGLRLDEGAWTDHKPRPIPLHWFATEECEFLGALGDEQREALLTFWKATKMLGRA